MRYHEELKLALETTKDAGKLGKEIIIGVGVAEGAKMEENLESEERSQRSCATADQESPIALHPSKIM